MVEASHRSIEIPLHSGDEVRRSFDFSTQNLFSYL